MKIDCYISTHCGTEAELRDNISKALSLERIHADVSFYCITNDEANTLGLKGSPSVLIDGEAIQPVDNQGFS
ncbi:MAG: hypothetical protein HY755_06055 [Nitrospirae bacterium]|nr:hypothetical protein [Nitrospirota bacterium]